MVHPGHRLAKGKEEGLALAAGASFNAAVSPCQGSAAQSIDCAIGRPREKGASSSGDGAGRRSGLRPPTTIRPRRLPLQIGPDRCPGGGVDARGQATGDGIIVEQWMMRLLSALSSSVETRGRAAEAGEIETLDQGRQARDGLDRSQVPIRASSDSRAIGSIPASRQASTRASQGAWTICPRCRSAKPRAQSGRPSAQRGEHLELQPRYWWHDPRRARRG